MSNRFKGLLFVFVGATALVTACGTANDSGLFGGTPAPNAGEDSGAIDASRGVDGATTHDDAGLDSGQRADAAPPPPKDASPPPPDANPPPVDSGSGDLGIRCGLGANLTECAVGTEVCCRSTVVAKCTAPAACNGGGLAVPCDDTQDCVDMGMPGTMCCADLDSQGAASKISCIKEAECTRAQNRTNLCDSAAPNPCPNGGTCAVSTFTLPGYTICR